MNFILRSKYHHPTSKTLADAAGEGIGRLSIDGALPIFGIQHPKFKVDVTVRLAPFDRGARR